MAKRHTILCIAITAILASACQYWPQAMADAAHDGNVSGETSISLTNVASLHEMYSVPGIDTPANNTGITAAGGKLYLATGAGLVVTSMGGAGCSGSPKVCQPLWTAAKGYFGIGGVSEPAVSNGIVFQSSEGVSSGDLRAFDANGVTNCSGTPTVCQPLWTAAAPSQAGPVVDGSRLFINSGGNLEAYDANGVTNCSGSPTVCQPLWTAPVPARGIPTVAGGKVYDATSSGLHGLEVFDEVGTTGCSGSPKVCQPLFTAPLPDEVPGSVAVSGGVAYVLTGEGLFAVDANGSTGCSGTPLVCQPMWSAPSAFTTLPGEGTPAIAGGHVFVLAMLGSTGSSELYQFDAAGVTGCSGTPVVCYPASGVVAPVSSVSPTISNGIVWTGGQAWNATDLTACASPPCSPLVNLGGAYGATTISLGTVFLNTGTSVEAFGL